MVWKKSRFWGKQGFGAGKVLGWGSRKYANDLVDGIWREVNRARILRGVFAL